MKRLNLIHALRIGKSFLAPMVLMGLFLFLGASEASAQNFKNYKDSQVILRTELSQINQEGMNTFSTKTDLNGENAIDVNAKVMFYQRVLRSINKDVDVEIIVNETFERLSEKYANTNMSQAIIAARDRTVQLLTN